MGLLSTTRLTLRGGALRLLATTTTTRTSTLRRGMALLPALRGLPGLLRPAGALECIIARRLSRLLAARLRTRLVVALRLPVPGFLLPACTVAAGLLLALAGLGPVAALGLRTRTVGLLLATAIGLRTIAVGGIGALTLLIAARRLRAVAVGGIGALTLLVAICRLRAVAGFLVAACRRVHAAFFHRLPGLLA